MASIYRHNSRDGWCAQVYVRGLRRKLWLGPVSKSAARSVAAHLDALTLARDTGTIPPAETRRWLSSLSGRLRNRLAAWGLIDQQAAVKCVDRTLGPYLASLIESRTDWSVGTKTRMTQVRLRLIQQLGSDTALVAVTPGDAQRFARWCRNNIASHSHSGKTIADARQLFKAAIADRILVDNPFSGIDSSQKHDESRAAYVSTADTAALLAQADPYYAALIACARFGGLRVPSEPLQLQWSQIDWERGRFVVNSPKLIHHEPTRVVPLFAELRPHLDLLHELAPDRALWAFDRYRSTAARVYRQTLERLIKRAGLSPWPKLWMNLRASCRTDLLERFPVHVVDAWLGHSTKIGSKHYDRIHEGHFETANAGRGVARGVVIPHSAASTRQPAKGNH